MRVREREKREQQAELRAQEALQASYQQMRKAGAQGYIPNVGLIALPKTRGASPAGIMLVVERDDSL